jgi:hypothetical protein
VIRLPTRPPEPETIEQVFEWAHRIIRAQKPAQDTLHAIRNDTERAAVWEAAAKRIAAIAKAVPPKDTCKETP